MTDQYQHWREALAAGRGVETERGNPRSGYYRYRNEAIAFWRTGETNTLCAWRSGKFPVPTRDDEINDLFGFCAPHPVSFADYKFFREHHHWPEQIAKQIADESVPLEKRLESQIHDLTNQAQIWLTSIGGKVSNQAQADKSANFSERFAELERQAFDTHREEKAPHLEAGRAVDARWKGLIDAASRNKQWAKDLPKPWLQAERDRLNAEAMARKKAEEAAIAAARLAGEPDPLPTLAGPPPKAGAGTQGRRISLRGQRVVRITDMRAFLVHLSTLNDHREDFIQAVMIQARRMLAAGLKPPGVEETVEDKVV
jgi:hypothetical protein